MVGIVHRKQVPRNICSQINLVLWLYHDDIRVVLASHHLSNSTFPSQIQLTFQNYKVCQDALLNADHYFRKLIEQFYPSTFANEKAFAAGQSLAQIGCLLIECHEEGSKELSTGFPDAYNLLLIAFIANANLPGLDEIDLIDFFQFIEYSDPFIVEDRLKPLQNGVHKKSVEVVIPCEELSESQIVLKGKDGFVIDLFLNPKEGTKCLDEVIEDKPSKQPVLDLVRQLIEDLFFLGVIHCLIRVQVPSVIEVFFYLLPKFYLQGLALIILLDKH